MTRIIFFSFITLLTSCASNQSPFDTTDGQLLNSETAVFSAINERHLGQVSSAEIVSVDGELTKGNGGPMWVRVSPKSHSFEIKAKWDEYSGFDQASNWSGHTEATVMVNIPEMKARHVYLAKYKITKTKIYVTFEDLGKDPYFGFKLSSFGKRNGSNATFYPVSFEDEE
ncbi:hypothetical protein [Agarivorans albus]|nr:hypothetical protein [Agarivorans albus]